MTEPPSALHVADLEVRYYGGPEAAVQGVSLSVAAGAGFCVAGGAGSGKTSVVRAILGLTVYTGEIVVLGGSPSDGSRRRRVAYGPQAANFAVGLTPRQTLELIARLRGVPLVVVPECLRRAGLAEDRWDRPTGLDSADSRRLSLALGVAGDPGLVVLDDPPNDPATEVVVRDARRSGAAVLVAVTDPWPELLTALDGPVLTLVEGKPE